MHKIAACILVVGCLVGEATQAAMSPEMRAQAEAMLIDEVSIERFGAWEFRETRDVLTGNVNYRLDIDGARTGGKAALITAQCQSDKPSVFVLMGETLGRDGTDARVALRFDDAEVQWQQWPITLDGQAISYPVWAIDWLKKLATAETLLLRTFDRQGRPLTAAFVLSEGQAALSRMAEACRWKLD